VPHLAIFNIGTGHNRNEKDNLLVKLFDDSPALAVDDDTIDKAVADPPKATIKLDGDRKVINDGLGSKDESTGGTGKEISLRGFVEGFMGVGVKSKADRMVKLVERLKNELTEVTIVGHSRGASIAVGTAAHLWEKKIDLPVDLWLLDPVEFSADASSWYNRKIHPNVRHCRIVVMEDVHDICGYKGGFKLQTLLQSSEPDKKTYIRMPGSHGTGSQVNGNPIGEVTYQIARRDFWMWNVPVGANVWSNQDISNEYFRIHEVNPVTHKEVSWIKRQLGYTELSRQVNDEDKPTGFKTETTDSRARKLDAVKITNRFRGHLYFINEHHFKVFHKEYPLVANAVIELSNNVDMTWAKVVARMPRIDAELKQMRKQCPRGHDLLAHYMYD
jgi:hypothetical protein